MKNRIILFFVFIFTSVHAQFLDGVRQDDVVQNMQEKKKIEAMKKEKLTKELEAKKELLKLKAKLKKGELISNAEKVSVDNN